MHKLTRTLLTFYITKCFLRGIQIVLMLQLLGASPLDPPSGALPPAPPLGTLPADPRTWGPSPPGPSLAPPFRQFLDPTLQCVCCLFVVNSREPEVI